MNSDELVETPNSKKKPSLDRTVLSDQIREYLVDAILNGVYNAGDRIVETRIAQQLSVSQGAVREALRELEWMGFLESQPFSGTYVRNLSIADLQEIYPVRAALEALGCRLAAPRLTDEQLNDLEHMVEEMVQVSLAGDSRRMVELNYAFHQTIMNASGNSVLVRSWSLFQFSYWTTITTASLSNDLVTLSRRHYVVLEALRSRDPERAAQAMYDHLNGMIDLVNKQAGQTFKLPESA